jgi:hypothetical protein
MHNKREARIVVLSTWGTIAVCVLVGAIIEFVAAGTILRHAAPAVYIGLIFGVPIAAIVYGNTTAPRQCQNHCS